MDELAHIWSNGYVYCVARMIFLEGVYLYLLLMPSKKREVLDTFV